MKVDLMDLIIVSERFGESITSGTENNPDVNGDGVCAEGFAL